MSRLLLMDVGNTSTTLALGSRGRVTHVTRAGHLCTQREDLLSAVQSLVRGTQVERAVIGSVVPDETAQWRMALPEIGLAGLYVDHRTPMPVGIDYPRPATIGADRLANSSAAWVRYGTASIVADFGTALTFDIISAEGNYVGGVIAPGLAMMTESGFRIGIPTPGGYSTWYRVPATCVPPMGMMLRPSGGHSLHSSSVEQALPSLPCSPRPRRVRRTPCSNPAQP